MLKELTSKNRCPCRSVLLSRWEYFCLIHQYLTLSTQYQEHLRSPALPPRNSSGLFPCNSWIAKDALQFADLFTVLRRQTSGLPIGRTHSAERKSAYKHGDQICKHSWLLKDAEDKYQYWACASALQQSLDGKKRSYTHTLTTCIGSVPFYSCFSPGH